MTATMGGTATIFSRSGDDFIRISTNGMKESKRAIRTKLVLQGRACYPGRPSYYGEVDIPGKPYLTSYESLKDANGQAIGMSVIPLIWSR